MRFQSQNEKSTKHTLRKSTKGTLKSYVIFLPFKFKYFKLHFKHIFLLISGIYPFIF